MTGHQLRLLRALRRGPLYEGAAALVIGKTPAHTRRLLRDLNRQGYVTGHLNLAAPTAAPTWELTDAGRETVEAMTP